MQSAAVATKPVQLDFGAGGHLYATHPLHAFAAKCPPPLASWAIERYTGQGEVVLDPMAGSGTTMVEAGLLGRTPWGIELDPLARLIASVKSRPIDPGLITAAAARAEKALGKGVRDSGWRPDVIDLDKWFRKDVCADLARLRTVIPRTAGSDEVEDLMWVVFSSLIVARTSVANARDVVHSRHHFREWAGDPETTVRFVRRLVASGKMMADFRSRLERNGVRDPKPVLKGTDARRMSIRTGSVNLVFTSPPYCSALDYTRAHFLTVAWLADVLDTDSDSYRELGRKYVGSERAPLEEATSDEPLPPALGHAAIDDVIDSLGDHPKRSWIVYRYFRDMMLVIGECGRVLKPGGRAVLVVCPSNIRRVRIPTHEFFAAIAPTASKGALAVEELHERTIHDQRRLMPYIAKSFGPRMRTEYVLVLRKKLAGGRG